MNRYERRRKTSQQGDNLASGDGDDDRRGHRRGDSRASGARGGGGGAGVACLVGADGAFRAADARGDRADVVALSELGRRRGLRAAGLRPRHGAARGLSDFHGSPDRRSARRADRRELFQQPFRLGAGRGLRHGGGYGPARLGSQLPRRRAFGTDAALRRRRDRRGAAFRYVLFARRGARGRARRASSRCTASNCARSTIAS